MIGFALSFLVSIVITNVFNAEIYGDYVLVYSTLDMFALFSLLGYNQLFSIEIPKLKTDSEKFSIYKMATKRSFINCIVLSILLILFAFVYPFKQNNIPYFIVSGAICLPVIALTIVNTNFLYSLKETFLPQLNDKIVRIVLFIALLFFFSSFSNSILVVITAFISSTTITYFISLLLRKRRINPMTSDLKPANKFSKTIYLLLIINTINLLFSKTDALQMAYYLGPDYAGVNNVYMKMSHILHLVMSSSLLIFSPKISKIIAQERFDLVRKELKKVFRFAIPFSLVLLVLVILLSPIFLSFYKSNLYQIHSYSVTLYSISAILGILTGPAAMILMLSNKLNHLIIGYGLELILNLILNAIFIPRYSIEGAAYATIISELVVNLYFTYICYKEFKLNTLFFGK
jgi:O-antigen/teichoic acid export membrane protein